MFAMSTILFVYGSLKRGQRNHYYLAGQEFLGTVRTAPLYRLFDWGPYPALVECPTNGIAIEGELWRIDDAGMARIEQLEEAPTLYQIRNARIEAWPDAMTYIYQKSVEGMRDCGPSWP